MFDHRDTWAIHGLFALTIPVVAAAWLVAVPSVLSTSTFLTILALVMGFAFVLQTTYANGRPAASLAQSIHDADRPLSSKRSWRKP